MTNDKVAALTGFAVKSGAIVYGHDRIEATRKRMYLIVMDNTAKANTSKSVCRIAENRRIPLVISKIPLDAIVFKKNCKVIAITEENLSKGIIAGLNENYIEVK